MKLTRRNYLALSAAALTGAAACRAQAAPDIAAAAPMPPAPKGAAGLHVIFTRPDCLSQFRIAASDVAPGPAVGLRLPGPTAATMPADDDYSLNSDGVIAKFAKLVNADPDEITFVQSTTTRRADDRKVPRPAGIRRESGHRHAALLRVVPALW